MTQTTNTDRDPIDQLAVARAACYWCCDTELDDGADAAFEAVLIEQGVMAPDDAIDAIEIASCDYAYCVVHFDCGDAIEITRWGSVHAIDAQ